MRTWISMGLLCSSFLLSAGCGGGTSHLPKLRPPADDEDFPAQTTNAGGAETGTAAVGTPEARAAAARKAAGSITAAELAARAAQGQQADSSADPFPPLTAADELTELQRRERVAQQLALISQALAGYSERSGSYPNRMNLDHSGRPALSWRVFLLPQLGYKSLYQKFRLAEPWDSPRNRELLSEIPGVYQSPERKDDKTNFLLVTGANTAYPGNEGLNAEECPDRIYNTVILVEAGDHLARPWTQPEDYLYLPRKSPEDLFSLRKDGCFAIFGAPTGQRMIPANISDEHLQGLLTPAGGESVTGIAATKPIAAEPDAEILAALAEHPMLDRFVPVEPGAEKKTPPDAVATAKSADASVSKQIPSVTARPPEDSRFPVPTNEELSAASALMRDAYSKQLEKAKKTEAKSDEKKELARELLSEVSRLKFDPAGQYVVLRAARDVAAQAGESTAALQAVDQLATTFRVDRLPMSIKVLEDLAAASPTDSQLESLLSRALSLNDEALSRDDFNSSKQLLALALNFARRTGKREPLSRVSESQKQLEQAKRAHAKVSDYVLLLLRSPHDAAANAAVGKYLCLVKREWEKGLPLLSQGNASELQQLAALDLQAPASAEEQAELGNRWWTFAESQKADLERDNAHRRAIHWYQLALPTLADGLPKVLAEKRIAEIGKHTDDVLKKSGVATGASRTPFPVRVSEDDS